MNLLTLLSIACYFGTFLLLACVGQQPPQCDDLWPTLGLTINQLNISSTKLTSLYTYTEKDDHFCDVINVVVTYREHGRSEQQVRRIQTVNAALLFSIDMFLQLSGDGSRLIYLLADHSLPLALRVWAEHYPDLLLPYDSDTPCPVSHAQEAYARDQSAMILAATTPVIPQTA